MAFECNPGGSESHVYVLASLSGETSSPCCRYLISLSSVFGMIFSLPNTSTSKGGGGMRCAASDVLPAFCRMNLVQAQSGGVDEHSQR